MKTTHYLEIGQWDGVPYRADIVIDRDKFLSAVKRATRGKTRQASMLAKVVVHRNEPETCPEAQGRFRSP